MGDLALVGDGVGDLPLGAGRLDSALVDCLCTGGGEYAAALDCDLNPVLDGDLVARDCLLTGGGEYALREVLETGERARVLDGERAAP